MYEIKFKQNTKMWKLVWEKQMESFTMPNSLHKTLVKGKGQGAELKKNYIHIKSYERQYTLHCLGDKYKVNFS
jgi:hypothetical protein